MKMTIYKNSLTWIKNNIFIISYSAILIFIIALPLIFGYSQQTDQNVFSGVRAPDQGDYWVYFSRIEQTLQGNIFHNYLYSSENLPRIQFYPIWIFFGLIAKILSVNSLVAFNILLLGIIPLLIFTLNKLVKLFIDSIFWQRLTVVAITLYSGLDWLFWPIYLKYFNYLGFDLNLPDTHVFSLTFHSPHLTACLILMCWIFYSIIRLEQSGKIIYSYVAGLLSAILFLSHPYQIPPVALGLFFYYSIIFINYKSLKSINKLLPFILINILVALYLLFLWKSFPVLRLWNEQNQILKFLTWQQNFIFLTSSLGIPLIISVIYFFKTKLSSSDILLFCWLGATLIAFFLPIGWSAKSILGITIPLIIISTKYLLKKSNQKLTKLITIFFFTFFLPCNIYLVFANINNYTETSNINYYLPIKLYTAINNLKSLPQNSIILAPVNFSIMIPAIAGKKVFIGHRCETLNFSSKYNKINEYFFSPNDEFLKLNEITHIFNKDINNNYSLKSRP